MEEAAVHAVDGLAGMPELIFVLGILAILSVLAAKVVPIWQKLKEKRLDNDAKIRQAQVDIERDREFRKMEESKQRFEREKENATIMARSVAAQEQTNVVMAETNANLAVLSAKLEVSQQGSMSMRETVADVAVEVHDIHNAVVK